MDRKGESSLSIADALEDQDRVDYYRGYLTNVQLAVEKDEVDMRGYFAWSLIDNLEWLDGFTKRFGIHYVDHKSPVLARYPKRSAQFYSHSTAPPAEPPTSDRSPAPPSHVALMSLPYRRLRVVPPTQRCACHSTAQAHGENSI